MYAPLILIKALHIIKMKIPNVELRLAGSIGRTDIFGDGYLRFVIKLARKLKVYENITWLGAIDAAQIVTNLQEASVFVNPSFVESYSLTFTEAMCVGTPSVVSFAGAMPELAENNKEALFFTPCDYKQCAFFILKLLSNDQLATKLSENAIKRSNKRANEFKTEEQQILTYKNILAYNE